MRGVPVLRPSGEIDIAAVARLRPTWLALIDEARPELVVVDLADVTFVDVAGAGLLVALRKRQALHGGRLHLRCVAPQAARLLELIGLAALFPVETGPRRGRAPDVVDLRVLDEEPQLRDR